MIRSLIFFPPRASRRSPISPEYMKLRMLLWASGEITPGHTISPLLVGCANSIWIFRSCFFRRVSMSSTAIISPSFIIPTLRHIFWTSLRVWEEKNMVVPLLFSSCRISKNLACINGSSPLVGSSRINNWGWWIRLCKIETFFWFPRERSKIFLFTSRANTSASSFILDSQSVL